MVEVLVEFDYIAEQDDELTIKVGEVIRNVVKSEGGWWEGELNGKKGMFPDNFVKEITKPPTKEPPKEPTTEKDGGKKGHHIAELRNKLGTNIGHVGAPLPSGVVRRASEHTSKARRKVRAKVQYSYSPENEDELKLEAGDTVEVLKQEEEGWWMGSVNGKTGVFPSNFVELVEGNVEDLNDKEPETQTTNHESTDENKPAEEEPKKEEGVKEIKGKKIHGIGLGNIFSGGPIKLRQTAPDKNPPKRPPERPAEPPKESHRESVKEKEPTKESPREHVKDSHSHKEVHKEAHKPHKETSHTHTAAHETKTAVAGKRLPPPVPDERPPQLPPKDKPVEKAKVLFSYTAENDDELSLEEGDIVTVLDKELEDSGWWKGELKGQKGVFPDNFVELLPPEEPKPRKPPPPVSQPSSGNVHLKSQESTEKVDKPALPDPIKPENKPSKNYEKTAPALPAKKPALPPPVSKKPVPSRPSEPKIDLKAEHKTLTHTESKEDKSNTTNHDHKAEKSTNGETGAEPSVDGFDSVSSSEKLTHLTVSRAKNPHKTRPPSQAVLHKDSDESKDVEHVQEPPWAKDMKRGSVRAPIPDFHRTEKEKKEPEKPAVPSIPPVKRPPPPQINKHEEHRESKKHVISPRTSNAQSTEDHASVIEMRQEIRDLKENSVSKDAYNQLKNEIADLRKHFEEFKNIANKRIKDLMDEVDDEKKIRLNTQVEMERIKKLVT